MRVDMTKDVSAPIKLWLDNGFSLETLSMITKIPIETLEILLTGAEPPKYCDVYRINYLTAIPYMTFHSIAKKDQKRHVVEIGEMLMEFFKIEKTAFVKYLGITEELWNNYLIDDKGFPEDEKSYVMMRVFDLQVNLVRDPRFSIGEESEYR